MSLGHLLVAWKKHVDMSLSDIHSIDMYTSGVDLHPETPEQQNRNEHHTGRNRSSDV